MSSRSRKRLYAIAFSLAVALMLGGFAYTSSAADLDITSPTTALCPATGAMAPAVNQGTAMQFSLRGFRAAETVVVNIAFPDGRYMDLQTARSLDGPVTIANPNLSDTLVADPGGDIYFEYTPSTKWPAGCYMVYSTGLSSGISAAAKPFVINAPAPLGGTAILSVGLENGGAVSGMSKDLVKLSGGSFGADEQISISIQLPNGTSASFPQQPVTSASGEFVATFRFNETSLPGNYTFIAQGKQTGHRAMSTFVLNPTPITATTNKLTVIVAPNPLSPNSYHIEIHGEQFKPLEGITLQVKVPLSNVVPAPPSAFGATYTLHAVQANQNGKFATAFDLTLGPLYSAGTYLVLADGSDSGKESIATFVIPTAVIAPAAATPGAPVSSTPAATITATTTLTPTAVPAASPTPLPATPTAGPTATPASDQPGGAVSGEVIIINNYNVQENSADTAMSADPAPAAVVDPGPPAASDPPADQPAPPDSGFSW